MSGGRDEWRRGGGVPGRMPLRLGAVGPLRSGGRAAPAMRRSTKCKQPTDNDGKWAWPPGTAVGPARLTEAILRDRDPCAPLDLIAEIVKPNSRI